MRRPQKMMGLANITDVFLGCLLCVFAVSFRGVLRVFVCSKARLVKLKSPQNLPNGRACDGWAPANCCLICPKISERKRCVFFPGIMYISHMYIHLYIHFIYIIYILCLYFMSFLPDHPNKINQHGILFFPVL